MVAEHCAPMESGPSDVAGASDPPPLIEGFVASAGNDSFRGDPWPPDDSRSQEGNGLMTIGVIGGGAQDLGVGMATTAHTMQIVNPTLMHSEAKQMPMSGGTQLRLAMTGTGGRAMMVGEQDGGARLRKRTTPIHQRFLGGLTTA